MLANVVGDDGADGRAARGELAAAEAVAAPDLVDVETIAVLRKRWIDGTLSTRRFAVAVEDLQDLAIERYQARPFLERAYELRSNITAYDAMYVALAETLDCDLVTGDRKLVNAPGPRCTIRLLSPAASA